MGISFKVSKTGRRFRPAPSSAAVSHAEDEESIDASIAASKTQNDAVSLSTRKQGEATENKGFTKIGDNEVSFTLKLFPDGYSIGKPVENESGNQTSIDVPKFLHPYDRASEALFSAIESGRLPGDILDDLLCKYIDGTLVCEVRDYRKCFPEGVNVPSAGIAPITNRVSLKMSLENIIKDIPAISENGWTYGDLMEVESRILKAIQPQLCLDPTPQLERLSINPVQNKLNLELRSMRRKRLRQIPEVVVSSNNNHGKKVYLDRVPESSRLGDTGGLVPQQPSYDNNNVSNPMLQTRSSSFGSDGSLLPSPIAYPQSKYTGVASPRMIKGSPGGQDMMIPFADNIAANIHGKRENQDGQSSPLSKKARITHPGVEGNMQHLGQQIDASELQWKQTLLQPQSSGRGIQYSGSGMQKFPTQVFEGEGQMSFAAQQQGMRYNLKEEPVETDQQRMPHQMIRSNFPQSPWSNLDSNPRKLVVSPHVSSGLPQSPLSSKSGEFSSGSIGHQFGAAVTKDKPAVSSVNPSSANDSMHRQNQALSAAKRRSNSLPKAPPISGVGSPASVGNMSQPLGDQTTLERFSKIEIVAMRFQLNCKKNKVDEYPMRKNNAYSAQQLMTLLVNDSNNENPKDETCKMPLSKSLVGGNMNVCKTRILNFIQTERILQGNSYQLVPKARTRMIMSEKPNDGAVAIHIGEIEDAEYLAAEEYLPTLPNTHMADLLAAQYSSLMTREGYHVEDLVQPKPSRTNSTQPNNTPPSSEMQQFSDGGVPLQQSSDAAKPVVSSQNMQGQRMLPLGNNQSMQMSGGLLLPGVSVNSRPQQTEQLPPQQQQQQFQRPPVMLPTNSMQHLNNMQMGGHMTNKPSPLHIQLMQQQQNQNQNQNQAAMQRKMMPGLGNVGMGNLGNNMVGLGGLGNVMGMGGGRGVGVSGISAPMGSISNMNQNAMNLSSTSNLSNAIRNLTPQQAAFMKMRMANQNRANILGNPQSGIGGIPGARQMHPNSGLSMLGPSLNRANMNPMQRTAMGPPKMLPGGMNLYTNQQQQLQQMQQMQQIQQQQQQMQQIQQQQQQPPHQQQQETTSPLQGVMSPPHQVGSPSSSMGGPHQMNQQPLQQQQQMMQTQASPQQMSSMGGGNPVEAGPGSPQLSSQTMGSVGSIANSPMEMQGVNKSNSVNNA